MTPLGIHENMTPGLLQRPHLPISAPPTHKFNPNPDAPTSLNAPHPPAAQASWGRMPQALLLPSLRRAPAYQNGERHPKAHQSFATLDSCKGNETRYICSGVVVTSPAAFSNRHIPLSLNSIWHPATLTTWPQITVPEAPLPHDIQARGPRT